MSASRGIVRSLVTIGSAQFVNILISLLRIKILAMMTGPLGIGLLGILSNLRETAAMIAGLGLGTSAVRTIAGSKDDVQSLSLVRIVLVAANAVQGAIAMMLIWIFRDTLSIWLFATSEKSTETALVGIAVFLTLVSASQTALLQGLRQIEKIGRTTVLSALAGTFFGLLAIWLAGEDGLVWFLIAQPATSVLVAYYYTRQLAPPQKTRIDYHSVWKAWRPMLSLGVVFMLSGLALPATLLFVRGLISQTMGLEEVGFFSAAWTVAITYLGFLFSAMSVDYYPRLVGCINDTPKAIVLMNDQMQIGLAIGGPLLLLLIGLAPWLITLFYSEHFLPATEMLQWQAFGSVIKLIGWPLGFSLVAAGRSKFFLSTQLIWNLAFFLAVWLGMPSKGLAAVGIGFTLAYVIGFSFTLLIVRRLHGFRFEKLSLRIAFANILLALVLLSLSMFAPLFAALAAIPLALLTGIYGLRVVLFKIGSEGHVSTRLRTGFKAIGWPVD